MTPERKAELDEKDRKELEKIDEFEKKIAQHPAEFQPGHYAIIDLLRMLRVPSWFVEEMLEETE